jgi:integrase
MARHLGKLNPKTVTGSLAPGRYGDGGNLYLIVDTAGAKRWAFIFRFEGRQREMGLGSCSSVSLARAREKAAAARELLAEGRSPLAEREEQRAIPTFGQVAEDVLAALSPGFSNQKHRDQWAMTLRVYAKPLWAMSVATITTADVQALLQPIWLKVPETADRTRQRIERVLDAAEARGYRPGGMRNPASWRGNLEHLLPARKKLTRGHHPAMPVEDVPALMQVLRGRDVMSSLILQFIILTACRTTEARKATWSEIDLEAGVWTVPAKRMKGRRPHRVPLSEGALGVLERCKEFPSDGLIFPGHRQRPLSNMAMTMLLRGLEDHFILHDGERRAATSHGFRSSFRDWAGSMTEYPRELAEEALAHMVGNAVERAYRRQDALERRRQMMADWDIFLSTGTENARLAAE